MPVLGGWDSLLNELPLFLCSLQLFTLPLVCFTKGNFQKAMADLILIWGFVGAIMGTFLATEFTFNNAFSFFPLVSVFTHCVSGFASLYIGFSKLFTLNKKTLLINIIIMLLFSGFAWIGAIYTPQNYMFLVRPDGTPFEIFYKLFNGSKIWYPISIIVLQLVFLWLFYLVAYIVRKIALKKVKP